MKRTIKSVKRSITLTRPLDAFVLHLASARAKPHGKRPNYSEVISDMVVRAKEESETSVNPSPGA